MAASARRRTWRACCSPRKRPKPTQIAYRGTGPAMNDLIGGHVDYFCEQAVSVTGQINSGAIKAYVVSSPQRLSTLPDVPTAKELGLDYLMDVGRHLRAKGRAADVIDKLADALDKSLDDPTACRCGSPTLGGAIPEKRERTPAKFETFVKAEIARWSPILKAASEPGKSASSIHRQSAGLDRAGPLGDFGSDERAEIAPTSGAPAPTGSMPSCFMRSRTRRVYPPQRRWRLGAFGTIGAGVSFGMKNAAQFAASKSRRPCSCAVGTFGEARGARAGQHRDRLDLTALDQRDDAGGVDADVVDAAGDDVLHRRSPTAVGNVGDVDADRGVEQRAAEMRRRAGAGRGQLHLVVVGAGVGDELGDCSPAGPSASPAQRQIGEQRDRREIGGDVIRRVLRQRLRHRMGADIAEARTECRPARPWRRAPHRSCRHRRRRSRSRPAGRVAR